MRTLLFVIAILLTAIATLLAGVLMVVNGVFAQDQPASAELTNESVRLPIIMYHKIAKSNPTKYSVTPEQLESDYKALNDAGYTAVFMREVIDWVDGRGTLPEKPVVITFDDGQYNNYFYGFPVAKKFNTKYMICPVTSFSQKSIEQNDTQNPAYSHLSWDEIRACADTGLIEIGNHTHKMHAFKPRYGIKKISGESHEEYISALRADIEKSQELITSAGAPRPTTFAYPFGSYNTEAREFLTTLGFRAFLTCNERVSTITRGCPETLLELGRFNRSGTMTTEEFLKKIGRGS